MALAYKSYCIMQKDTGTLVYKGGVRPLEGRLLIWILLQIPNKQVMTFTSVEIYKKKRFLHSQNFLPDDRHE